MTLDKNYVIPIESSVWTSASSEGLYCGSERTFAWCSSGAFVEQTFVNNPHLWTAIPNGNESLANCVSLELSKNESSVQLALSACSESKSSVCQVSSFLIKIFLKIKHKFCSQNVKMQLIVQKIAAKM
jgi:hypothetical protein